MQSHVLRSLRPWLYTALLGALTTLTLPAATTSWTGGAGTTVLNTPGNWLDGIGPTSGDDTATWDGSQGGNLSLNWSGNYGDGTNGLNISLLGTQTGSLTLDATSGVLSVHAITIAAGAGAFTLGDGIGTSTITLRGTSPHVFTNNSSNTATLGADLVINDGAASGRNLTFTGSGNWLVNGSLNRGGGGSISVTKSGAGTLFIAGSSAGRTSGTTISAGAIHVTHGSALGSGTVTSQNSGKLQISGNITLGGVTNFNLNGRNSNATNIENVSGNNIITGNLNFAGTGGNTIYFRSTAGALKLEGNLTTTSGIPNTADRFAHFDGAGSIELNGVISDGHIATGTVPYGLGVIKSGASSLTLTNNNTYSGTTVINAGGAIFVEGSHTGAGSYTVSAANARLGGSGSITGKDSASITLGTTSFLVVGKTHGAGAGNSAVGLDLDLTTTTGNIALQGTMQFDLYSNSLDNDRLDLATTSGTIDLTNGQVQLAVGEGTDTSGWSAGRTWKLIDWTGNTATTTGLALTASTISSFSSQGWQLMSYVITDGSGSGNGFYVNIVPEPGRALLLFMALGLTALRRRR